MVDIDYWPDLYYDFIIDGTDEMWTELYNGNPAATR